MNDKRQRLLEEIFDVLAANPLDLGALVSPSPEDRQTARLRLSDELAPKLSAQEDPEIEYDDVIAWADGVLGALGTEYADRVTDKEAELANLIINVQRTVPLDGPMLPVSVQESEARSGYASILDANGFYVLGFLVQLEIANQIAAAINSAVSHSQIELIESLEIDCRQYAMDEAFPPEVKSLTDLMFWFANKLEDILEDVTPPRCVKCGEFLRLDKTHHDCVGIPVTPSHSELIHIAECLESDADNTPDLEAAKGDMKHYASRIKEVVNASIPEGEDNGT
ncbi:MAG: hypothetical protein MJA83_10225 [Gammaproteobacteria bacterium]|nr:hypothetical protein [Gammaproteobacteria bacterium]